MSNAPSLPAVAITFDCTPLRTVQPLNMPSEASPAYRARLERVRQAVDRHGTRNTYYLTNGSCTFQLTNDPTVGWVRFSVEGTLITDEADTRTVGSDLTITLDKETCEWLTQPAVQWLMLSARHALEVEFDRYIAAGDLARAQERLAREQAASDASGGFLGMNL
ncbi:MAG: hypothetical protein HQ464_04370 [Planctomycetes bacterium]|nr:hypothetical protein [Planctomycetota bacterium]